MSNSKTPNNQGNKQVNEMNRQLSEDDIKMANKDIKKCLTPLEIRERLIETVLGFYHLLVRPAIVMQINQNKFW